MNLRSPVVSSGSNTKFIKETKCPHVASKKRTKKTRQSHGGPMGLFFGRQKPQTPDFL